MKDKLHIAELITLKIQGKLDASGEAELQTWLEESDRNRVLYNRAVSPRKQLEKLEVYALFHAEERRAAMEQELFGAKTIPLFRRNVVRWAAAILLPILLLGGGYFLMRQPQADVYAELNKMIQPGTEKAVLVLASGDSVYLEDTAPIHEIREGNSVIQNIQQKLSYAGVLSNPTGKELVYHRLATPKGGSYQLQLSDGTQVWLNAGSSLRFPVAFSAGQRDVYLEGEAFFEVTHNGSPFSVHSGETEVAVLGTKFNVSAYRDDAAVITTLVEGKVKVAVETAGGDTLSEILKPDDQSVYRVAQNELMVRTVNASYFTSWTKGKIEFDDQNLGEVLKRLSRWYNFEYTFDNESAKLYHFTARLDRDVEIGTILEMLELTTDVRFEIKDGTVIIH